LKSLRESGYEPMAIASLAVLVGSAEAVRAVASLDELARLVDLAHLSRAPAKFDERELEALNARLVHEMPYSAIRDRLAELGVDGGEPFWLAVRANLTRWTEAAEWWPVVAGPIRPVRDDPDLAETALGLLPPGPWTGETWRDWTRAVAEATGRKGRALFMPLRLALTGLDHGPDLAALLPLIGPERAQARLAGEVA